MPKPSPLCPSLTSQSALYEAAKAVRDANDQATHEDIMRQFNNIGPQLEKAAQAGKWRFTQSAFLTSHFRSWPHIGPIDYEGNKEAVMKQVIDSLKEKVPNKEIAWRFHCPSPGYPAPGLFFFDRMLVNFMLRKPDPVLPRCKVTASWGPIKQRPF